ncbi:hypothetical protein GPJ56_006379 [Histomonas meleagridis]|uniref:uncharacterized protein n=1 Tax=Histomonas meleagridis TaxID=135588 RepID=UPI00355A0BFA|nr:hypothetical protein GPJ56_006379 [Histomonas meleagridis]KAH0796804.1 hypothetical protein GO595_010697 [Histomonas meleagridis]
MHTPFPSPTPDESPKQTPTISRSPTIPPQTQRPQTPFSTPTQKPQTPPPSPVYTQTPTTPPQTSIPTSPKPHTITPQTSTPTTPPQTPTPISTQTHTIPPQTSTSTTPTPTSTQTHTVLPQTSTPTQISQTSTKVSQTPTPTKTPTPTQQAPHPSPTRAEPSIPPIQDPSKAVGDYQRNLNTLQRFGENRKGIVGDLFDIVHKLRTTADIILPLKVSTKGRFGLREVKSVDGRWCVPTRSGSAEFVITLNTYTNAFFKEISFVSVPNESNAIRKFNIQFLYSGKHYTVGFDKALQKNVFEKQRFESEEYVRFSQMIIHVSENYGNETETCLYPFEVYGYVPE